MSGRLLDLARELVALLEGPRLDLFAWQKAIHAKMKEIRAFWWWWEL